MAWVGVVTTALSLGFAAQPAYAAGSADLEITQTASPSPAGQGAELTWTVVVTNHGPDDATGVEVNDNFNEFGTSTEFVSLSTSQGTCTHDDATFNCQLGTVRSGSNATMTLTVTVLNTSSVVNIADVTSSTSDPDWSNNHVSTTTPAGPSADLQLSKTVSPTSAAPGDTLTYTLITHNAGPSNASGVEIADSLPAGLEDASVAPSNACSITGVDVSCSPGTIVNGGSFTATITATIAASYTGSQLVNSATVAATTIDPDLSNNTGTATAGIEAPAADLAVTKVIDTDPVVAGAPVRYRVTVTDNGPGDAENASLTDPLPAVLSNASVSTDVGVCDLTGDTVGCDFGTISAGTTATVTIDATLATSATGQLSNTATASSATPDPDSANNSATAASAITASADLAISKVASTTAATNGDSVAYTMQVRDYGPSDAVGVIVTDPLPADLVYTPGSCTTPQGSCTYADGTLTYTLGDLGAGQSITLEYSTTVSGSTPDAELVNTATVSSGTPDPVAANNTASYALNVDAAADLSLTKTASPSPAVAGDTVTFTLTTHNNGPGISSNLALTDAVPSSVQVTNAAPSAGVCDSGTSNAVHCTVSSLANGTDWTVTITGILDAAAPAGALENSATVTGDDDPTTSNNTATVVVPTLSTASLSLTKTAPGTVTAGDSLTYALRLSNAGPSAAASTVVADTLPPGTRFESASGASCSPTGASTQLVLCMLDTVAPATSVEFSITVLVSGQTPDGTVLVNHARASSPVPGPSTGLDATASTLVNAVADLATVKSVAPDVLVAGAPAVYGIRVVNHGPSAAATVSVHDEVPGDLVVDSVSPAGGACTTAGNTIDCTRDSLSSGSTWAIIVHVTVAGDATGSVTNSATASSATSDPDPGNNSGTVNAQIETSADLQMAKTALFPARTPGQTDIFLLTAINNGPSAATDVTITDTFPAGITPTSVPAACTRSGQQISCTYASIASGATRTALVTAVIDKDAAGAITNSATVTSSTLDPTPGNNTSQATVTVTPVADLSLSKTANSLRPEPGGTVTYTIAVTNAGPSTANGVVLTDALPSAMTPETVTADAPLGCTVAAQTVTCAAAQLPVGSSTATITARLGPDDAGEISNTAHVTAQTEDPDPSNNSATAIIDVTNVQPAPLPTVPPRAVEPGGTLPATGVSGLLPTALSGVGMIGLGFITLAAARRSRQHH